MALPLTETDKFLLLSAVGAPETRDRIAALLDLAGTGNVTGPGSATDNAVVRFDGSTGALLQNSGVLVSDLNAISGVASLNGVLAATIAFLDATSSIQTQLNSKAPSASPTFTGQISAALGSVSAPSYSFSGDLNNGIYSSAADNIDFSTNGVNRVNISSTGLLVNGVLNATSAAEIGGNAAGSSTSSTILVARKDQNAITRFLLRNDSAGASASTNITLTAADDFNLSASGAGAGATVDFTASSGFTGGIRISANGSNSLALRTNSTQRVTLSGLGNVSIGDGALLTTATDGFFYIPSSSGAPTGVPTSISGRVPMHYDSTNNDFYIYNGAWKKVTLT